VVLVDDHVLIREGTEAALRNQADIVVVGATGSGAEAIQLVQEQHPDVLLLDVHLPDVGGIEVTRQVRYEWPGVAIIILTGFHEVGYARALINMGVQGYLYKTASGAEIVAAIRAAAGGQTVLLPEVETAVAELPKEALTPRELEIVDLLAKGQPNGEVAIRLGIGVKTVEWHIGHVLAKLRARSRIEAILKARQMGLLDPSAEQQPPTIKPRL
jgi:DNA-binding NarL/FixJ family response regulator